MSSIVHVHPRQPSAHVTFAMRDSNTVRIACLWPIDLESEEWFRFSGIYRASDIATMIGEKRDPTVPSRNPELVDDVGRAIQLTTSGGGEVTVAMRNGVGALSSSLILDGVFMVSELRDCLDARTD